MEKLENSNKILREKLKKLILNSDVVKTSISGLSIVRKNNPTDVNKCMCKPSFLYTLQGKKHSILGKEEVFYTKNQTLIITVELPISSRVIEATPENPYLAVILDIDFLLLTEFSKNIELQKKKDSIQTSIFVIDTDYRIIDAYNRLIDLLEESEEQQKILAPIIIKEIHYYYLIKGDLGIKLNALNTIGSRENQILKAINWIKNNFKENFTIEELAKYVNMSIPSFYRNFRKITTLSPIQYQKSLRLHEAQYLILSGEKVSNTAYLIGYESPTQFNREYKRLFGRPPRKDLKIFS